MVKLEDVPIALILFGMVIAGFFFFLSDAINNYEIEIVDNESAKFFKMMEYVNDTYKSFPIEVQDGLENTEGQDPTTDSDFFIIEPSKAKNIINYPFKVVQNIGNTIGLFIEMIGFKDIPIFVYGFMGMLVIWVTFRIAAAILRKDV